MKNSIRFTVLLLLFCCSFLMVQVFAQGAIINEVSNGPSGTQEYFELVVVGPDANPNCGPVDLRGWILDDNNGDFSCGPCAGRGIAPGHIRFGATGPWAAVPTGSIIVVYDSGTKNPMIPADDPNDTSPADGVYILPSSHTSLDVSTGSSCAGGNIPSGAGSCGSCGGNAAYVIACYTTGATTNIGLRNSGDAAQVRDAAGGYYHGIGYGTASSGITGGPDGLLISGSGSGRYYAFDNNASDDYRNVTNYVSGTVASLGETPGAPNSALNGTWITGLGTPCLLPISYLKPFEVMPLPNRNLLEWATSAEYNSDYFKVMRSIDPLGEFSEIGRLEAAGNSTQISKYEFADLAPPAQRCFYQLVEVDRTGETNISEIVEVNNTDLATSYIETYPNPSNGFLNVVAMAEGLSLISVCDAFGKRILEIYPDADTDKITRTLDLSGFSNGLYMLQMHSNHGVETRKVILQH